MRKASRLVLAMRSRRRVTRLGVPAVLAPFILREPQHEREEIFGPGRKGLRLKSLLSFSRDGDSEEGFEGDDVAVPAEPGDYGVGRVSGDGATAKQFAAVD